MELKPLKALPIVEPNTFGWAVISCLVRENYVKSADAIVIYRKVVNKFPELALLEDDQKISVVSVPPVAVAEFIHECYTR